MTMSPVKKRKLSETELRSVSTSSSTSDISPKMQRQQEVEDSAGSQTKTFHQLGVIDPLCDACVALGYKLPTPIQHEAIPAALEGRDIIVRATSIEKHRDSS